ncbi:MAG: nuclear transport factor 2 family protein [Bacteroidota bacterium]
MRQLRLLTLISITMLLLSTCTNTKQARIDAVRVQAEAFFETYAEREDWEKFCSFYSEDMQFEDVLLQLKLDSLWQFQRFYNWPDGNFQKLSPDQEHLIIDEMVVDENTVVARGNFQPFYWYDQPVKPIWGMQATFWLHFDEDLKIDHQIDWIEYDPSVLESVIKRVREKGVQRVPDWLDLER